MAIMFFSAIEKGYGLHNGNKKREKKDNDYKRVIMIKFSSKCRSIFTNIKMMYYQLYTHVH